MILQEFINKYFDKKTGNTPENTGQCVGLVSVWMDELGIAHEWGDAKDLLNNADTAKFDVIINNPNDTTQYPQSGDICVWDATWGNGAGHTGVIIIADGLVFDCFEQNNPTGALPHIVHHNNYSGVLGWLRPKNLTQTIQDSIVNKIPTYFEGLLHENRLDLNNESQIRTFFQQAIDYPHTKQDLDNAMTANKVQADQLTSLRQEIESEQKTNNELSVQVQNLQKQLQDIATKPQDPQNPSGNIHTWTLVHLLLKKIFH